MNNLAAVALLLLFTKPIGLKLKHMFDDVGQFCDYSLILFWPT